MRRNDVLRAGQGCAFCGASSFCYGYRRLRVFAGGWLSKPADFCGGFSCGQLSEIARFCGASSFCYDYRRLRVFAVLPIINCRNQCRFRISDKDAFSIIEKQERASFSDNSLSEQINLKGIYIKKDPAPAGSVSLYY